MLLGCCTTIENYPVAAAAGCDTITLAATDLAAMDKAAFASLKEIISSGTLRAVSLNKFCGQDVRLNGPLYSRDALSRYASPLFERAAALGVHYIGIGSPASRNTDPDAEITSAMTQFEDAIAFLCMLAAPYDIDILIEAVCDIECNFITTTAEALSLVERLTSNNLHLVYDIYHAQMMNERIENIDAAVSEIRVVHIAQDVGHGMRYYLDEDFAEEYRPYISRLKAVGYTGELSLEAFHGDVAAELPKSIGLLRRLCNETA